MSRGRGNRYVRGVDRNDGEVVRQLEQAFYSVLDLTTVGGGCPDKLVGGNMPCPSCRRPIRQNVLVEIKNAEAGGKLKPGQQKFTDIWRGPLVTAYTAADALRFFGIKV